MGADERFKRAKLARERNQFDAQLAQAVRNGDERAFPADMFGVPIRVGSLIMYFPQAPSPSPVTVTDMQPVLDPRAPAGALRVRCVFDIMVPAGTPNPSLLLLGDAPREEETAPPQQRPADPEPASEEPPARPALVITDAH